MLPPYASQLAIVLIFWILLNSTRNKSNPKTIITKKKFGITSITIDGRTVRSLGEKQIADWLTKKSISFIYEYKLTKYTPDFYLPDYNLIIEYYGFRDAPRIIGERYRNKILDKRKYFRTLSIELLELYPEDLSRLDHIILPLLHKKRII